MIRNLSLIVYILLFIWPNLSATASNHNRLSPTTGVSATSLFEEMQLEGKVNPTAFEYAIAGYNKITQRRKPILTLIDFSKPSNQKRLYVFDLEHKKLLYSSVVAHGKNSGGLMATHFSNREGSHQSSLGFFLTENTYQGRNGYSLVLDGLEKGINHHAKKRAIVVHGAAYANPTVIQRGGRLGRSFGCPALPQKLCRPIIDTIKEGSVVYIYAENPNYLAQSSLLTTEAPLSQSHSGSYPGHQMPQTPSKNTTQLHF